MSDTPSPAPRVAFVVANEGVEQRELTEPWEAVLRSGAAPTLVAPKAGPVWAFDHLDRADQFTAGATVAEVSVDQFDALVLPGGVASPDALRTDADAVSFIGDFVRSGKLVAVICHGAWTLVEADVVSGRTITSWPSVRTDLRNAGAEWVDREVVIDGNLISSRNPDDLPAFCEALTAALAGLEAVTAG